MKRVLIIEDDLTIARIYQGLLRMEGTDAEVASDGEAALAAIYKYRPDLILLDVMLPKVSGLEILKRLRSQALTRDLPVIVFSNAYLSRADQEALQIGPTQRLVKSETSPKVLLRAIRCALGVQVPGSLCSGDTAVEQPLAFAAPPPPSVTGLGSVCGSALDLDADFQDRTRQTLLLENPDRLRRLRACLQALNRGSTPEERANRLLQFQEICRNLSTRASLASSGRLARLSSALEALASDLRQRPAALNESCLRTLAQAVDLLASLCDEAGQEKGEGAPGGLVMVVDDEPISRRAVSAALTRAGQPAIELDDPKLALQVLEMNGFDLLFLDIDMPGMSGLELCQTIRATGRNRTTPIVFVTGAADFQNRALSIRSGGNDVIAKPFLGLELAVKALLYLLRSRSAPLPSPRLPKSIAVSSAAPLIAQPIPC